MSRCWFYRLASYVCACCTVTLAQFAGAAPEPPLHEDFIKCNVLDPEIFDHVMAYQEAVTAENPLASNGKLMIGRLKANPGSPPYTEESVFVWEPSVVDSSGVLPPLGATSNGPEIGFDGEMGYEVVWTKLNTATDPDTWFFARASNNCAGQTPTCWQVEDFTNDEFETDPPYANRWSPWVTQNSELPVAEAAKVTYNAHEAANRLPATGKRKAFRVLEDMDLTNEITIDGDADVATVGHWARIDDKDYIISTLGSPSDTIVDVVLYDPDDPTTPINLTGTLDGKYALGWIGFDAAAPLGGRYTLVTVRTDPVTEDSFMAVFQREVIDGWQFQYEFDAATADPALAGLDFYATSPEPFEYGGFLYIAFVVADALDFGSSTVGNIMLTRVEADDPSPEDNYYRILNTLDQSSGVPTRKRIEPEIHFMPIRKPAVYYTWVAGANDANCAQYEHKLMRALTDDLWDD